MLSNIAKKRNIPLQKALTEALAEGLRHELANIELLTGEKLEYLVKVLSIKTPNPEIYFNNFNMVICSEALHRELGSILKPQNMSVRVEIPKLNINVWCYEIYNDPLFSDLIGELNTGL